MAAYYSLIFLLYFQYFLLINAKLTIYKDPSENLNQSFVFTKNDVNHEVLQIHRLRKRENKEQPYLSRLLDRRCTIDDQQKPLCECYEKDFECDYGFVRDGYQSNCVRKKSLDVYNQFDIPKYCKRGEFYNRTKGYKQIYNGRCIDSYNVSRYLADVLPCPENSTNTFLIVASGTNISRIDLDNKKQDYLPVDDEVYLRVYNSTSRNIITTDFDYENNCLYFSDIRNKMICRLCFTNNESIIDKLVSTEIQSVEGMTLDPKLKLLYFVDGTLAKIDVIRTDINNPEHMRKTIIGPQQLRKPRGLALHSKAGYIFWTDWDPDSPSVSRANCDGSNIKQLFSKPTVIWPNGIAIDFIAERIYWVDARNDYIGSSDLDGNLFKKIITDNDNVVQPFGIAVFKEKVYWSDWIRKAVYSADKDDGSNLKELFQASNLMDLRVAAFDIRSFKNGCANNTVCTHLCLPAPMNNYTCACPNNMVIINNTCLCHNGEKPSTNGTCSQFSRLCLDNEFTCGNGKCVNKNFHCDSINDCDDGTDEVNCTYNTCNENQFTCGSGQCVLKKFRCDGYNDCGDETDELNCPSNHTCKENESSYGNQTDKSNCTNYNACHANEFACGNRKCIKNHLRCDNFNDCGDKTDELNCPTNNTCNDNQFACGNGKCIKNNLRCDFFNDCGDETDELNCPSNHTCKENESSFGNQTNKSNCTNYNACNANEFACGNGKCIKNHLRCDNFNDCGDKTDELNCPTDNTCNDNQFACGNGRCIKNHLRCDCFNNCGDETDEFNCPTNNSRKENKLSIPNNLRCDSENGCGDGIDEVYCSESACTELTLPILTSPPQNVTVTQRNSSHIEINYATTPESPVSHVKRYIINYSPPIPPHRHFVNSNTTSLLLANSNFEYGLEYTIWVTATDNYYWSFDSEPVKFKLNGNENLKNKH